MSVQCTEAEWKIMEVLWDHHPRTMGDITKTLEPATGWTRHTVITLLKRMHDKGSVAVDESGPVKLYSPMISREEASASQTRKLLDRVFNGNASLLINHLVDSGEMTVDEIQSLLTLLQKEEGKNTGGDTK
ncbi:MAG: BlaI/MecI/CopY family transcriptional regulator [Eubacteriales bacterium]|nr:BlaI/MecI/CopY family transcriptional regulator [Eubacteriales bacterium]